MSVPNSNNPDTVLNKSTSVSNRTPVGLMIPQPTFPFLALAPELRQKIFEHLFENYRVTVQCDTPECSNAHGGRMSDDHEDDYDDYHSDNSRLAITYVSKATRGESIAALLRTATFDFQLIDHHVNWQPKDPLRSYIGRMKNLYGPPRLLHHLHFTDLSWLTHQGEEGIWVANCTADNVVCDMIIDQFDIHDALVHDGNPEAKCMFRWLYAGDKLTTIDFAGVKSAIAGPKGNILTLCVQVEDADPTWTSWDDSHIRSGFQVWKRKVIVRRKPRTEPGKAKMKNVLNLLGLRLEEKDSKVVEPVKVDDADVATTTPSLTVTHAINVLLPQHNIPSFLVSGLTSNGSIHAFGGDTDGFDLMNEEDSVLGEDDDDDGNGDDENSTPDAATTNSTGAAGNSLPDPIDMPPTIAPSNANNNEDLAHQWWNGVEDL